MTGTIPVSLLPTLIAAVDRIIPADAFPSASQNGVVTFIDRIFSDDLRTTAEPFVAGLAALDAESRARHGSAFAQLTTQEQDQLLTQIERGDTASVWSGSAARWFDQLVQLTHEGYYADPSNGANLECISWKMVGFEPGRRP